MGLSEIKLVGFFLKKKILIRAQILTEPESGRGHLLLIATDGVKDKKSAHFQWRWQFLWNDEKLVSLLNSSEKRGTEFISGSAPNLLPLMKRQLKDTETPAVFYRLAHKVTGITSWPISGEEKKSM